MKLKKEIESVKKINPKETLKARRTYVDSIQEDLESDGVVFFQPQISDSARFSLNIDTDYLTLPKNITDTQNRDLGEYLNAYTQQKMYMRTLIGWVECQLEDAKRNFNIASREYYNELNKSKLSEASKERQVSLEEEVQPYYEKVGDLKKKLQLLNFNVYSIEDAIFMLSREVSRRTGDFNTENRSHNVGKK